MKFINSLIAIVFLSLSLTYAQNSVSPDNTLIKYYSAFLSLNLTHALDEARIIYHLSKEPSFRKDLMENEINKIKQSRGWKLLQIYYKIKTILKRGVK